MQFYDELFSTVLMRILNVPNFYCRRPCECSVMITEMVALGCFSPSRLEVKHGSVHPRDFYDADGLPRLCIDVEGHHNRGS